MKWVYIIICINLLGSNYYSERTKASKFLMEESFESGPIIEYYLMKETDPEKFARMKQIFNKYEEELSEIYFIVNTKDVKKYPFLDRINNHWREKLKLNTNFISIYVNYAIEKYNIKDFLPLEKFPDRWPAYRKATELFVKDLCKTDNRKYIKELISSMKKEEILLFDNVIKGFNQEGNVEEIKYMKNFAKLYLIEGE